MSDLFGGRSTMYINIDDMCTLSIKGSDILQYHDTRFLFVYQK